MATIYKEMKTIKFPNSDVVYVVTDDEKIEKNQGVENSGKIFGVDKYGYATLIDAETLETKIPENLLTYSEQTLTEEQQIQVRANIGAGTSNFGGDYNDLENLPELFSGSYNDLTDKPELFSGSYNDLSDQPELFSGDYNDLSNKPDIPSSIVVDDEILSDSEHPVQNKVIYAALSNKSDEGHQHIQSEITDFPSALKNPKAIQFTGASNASYDGSSDVTIHIPVTDTYDLPVATSATLGGVKPVDKTDAMTQDVGVGANGKLYTAAAEAITVDNVLSDTSTNPVQNKIINSALNNKSDISHSHDDKYYTESEIDTKIDTINTEISKKADSSHSHDDIYYTETEIDSKLNAKAESSHPHTIADITNLQTTLDYKAAKTHGNHVPNLETANNAKFLRNDNTWQLVTPANIGAAASDHTQSASKISTGTFTGSVYARSGYQAAGTSLLRNCKLLPSTSTAEPAVEGEIIWYYEV